MNKKDLNKKDLELLDEVECHFGNLVLSNGLSPEDEEYQCWDRFKDFLDTLR